MSSKKHIVLIVLNELCALLPLIMLREIDFAKDLLSNPIGWLTIFSTGLSIVKILVFPFQSKDKTLQLRFQMPFEMHLAKECVHLTIYNM